MSSFNGLKNPWVVIGVIAVVLIGGSIVYSNNLATSSNEGITFTPNVKGSQDASVTLVEYSDFQCPACAAFQPILNDVLAEFGDSINFEYKHFPLPMHTFAEPAARAAEAAGQQGKFFEFHDLLFINQKTWSGAASSLAFFTQYAEELELDVDLFKKHYGASMIKDRVREQAIEGRALGITGTPTFFLNGERMTIETYEDFYNQVSASVNSTSTEPAVKFGL
jgi:protein-disulfide isomerase